jgi:capsular polysaccharide transport system ATP-binding protein
MSIDLINVSKTYVTVGRRKTVFKNFNLTIPRGVNFGVIGPNGAGKSTLLTMISGQLYPDTGRINRNMSVSWPVGYGGAAATNLTGRLNCRFIARLYGRDPKEVTEFVADLSELGHYMDWPVKTYSSGMRSRLNFALSMAIDFDLLLVDEGLSAGDVYFREKAERAIEMRRQRASMLLVTHNLAEVVKMCDQVLVLGGEKPELSSDVHLRVKEYMNEYSLMRQAGKTFV